MTYLNLKGKREQLHAKGRRFVEIVTQFMSAKGYFVVRSSHGEGVLADLVFRRPIEGETETWAECKNTDLSLSDGDFLREMGAYYLAYSKLPETKRFKLFVFAKKCKSEDKWKKIFEEHKQEDESLRTFRDRIQSTMQTGQEIDREMFHQFICDTTAISADIESLASEARAQEANASITYEKDLLDEKPLILHRNETLILNAVRLKSFPKKIWMAKLKPAFDKREFWNENRDLLAIMRGGKLYSPTKLQPSNALNKYCEPGSISEASLSSDQFNEKERSAIILGLVRQQILQKAVKIGCSVFYDNKKTQLFFKKHTKNREVLRYDKRIVVKPYIHSETKKINFCRHDALVVFPQLINGECYVFFDVTWIFTKEGKEVITGEEAAKRHHQFTRSRAFNNTERSKLQFWINNLKLLDQPLFGENPLTFTELLHLTCPVTYEGGEEFDTTLLEYLEEENV